MLPASPDTCPGAAWRVPREGPICGRPEPPPCLHRLVLCIASEQGESLARTLQICIAPRASPACAGLRGSLRLPGFLWHPSLLLRLLRLFLPPPLTSPPRPSAPFLRPLFHTLPHARRPAPRGTAAVWLGVQPGAPGRAERARGGGDARPLLVALPRGGRRERTGRPRRDGARGPGSTGSGAAVKRTSGGRSGLASRNRARCSPD